MQKRRPPLKVVIHLDPFQAVALNMLAGGCGLPPEKYIGQLLEEAAIQAVGGRLKEGREAQRECEPA
jgi:hypothetical protein